MSRNRPIVAVLDAASMLARDVPVAEVARQMGVSERAIYRWSQTPEARDQIAAVRTSVREATKHLAVADKVRRIHHAQQMLDGILAVIAERRQHGVLASDPLPGEATGHVVVKVTEVTTGKRTTVTREAAFDAALHAEARKWTEYAAKELGDLETGISVRHSGRVDHVIRRPDLSALSDDELEALLPIAEKVAAGQVDR